MELVLILANLTILTTVYAGQKRKMFKSEYSSQLVAKGVVNQF